MTQTDNVIINIFYEIEKNDSLDYFEQSDLIKWGHNKLSNEEFMEFEESLNELACDLAKYWFIKGFHTAQEITSEMLGKKSEK